MQLFSIVVATLAFLPQIFAQQVVVRNLCTFPAYVRSVANNNQGTFPLITLPARNGTFTENYRAGGSAIKVSTQPQQSAPLTLEYTPMGNTVYYDVSNNAGNPFYQFRQTLVAGDKTCPGFNCGPQSTPMGGTCYSNGNAIKVKTCHPTPLTLTLCAA